MEHQSGVLRVEVLGTPGVYRGEERLQFPYRKTEGILYYLCVKKSAFRDELINVFWENCDEQVGRKNLRQALYELRKVLPEEPVKSEGQNRLYLDPNVPVKLDWEEKDEDVLLKGGDFLAFFYVKGASGFEEWVDECRAQQRNRCREAARRMIEKAVRTGNAKRLHEVLTAWKNLEPLEEEVIREAMEAYTSCGRYTMALRSYREYRERIQKELEEEPGEDLVQLYQQILRLKEDDAGQENTGEGRFYGRYSEIYTISRCLEQFATGKEAKSIVIMGEQGVGKSALLSHVSRSHRKRGIISFITHCYETEKEYSLKAFREWFQRMKNYAEEKDLDLSPEYRNLLDNPFSDYELRGNGENIQNFWTSGYAIWENRVIAMMREMLSKKKMVLLIDDMQWMDDLSRQLLQRLLLELGDDRFCFIGTYRSIFEGKNLDFLRRAERNSRVMFLTLQPFTRDESEEIVRAELPVGTADILTEEIYRRTEGNAFFLMDLLSMVRDQGWDAAAIPKQSEYVIQARLRSITPLQRQILNALSIFMEHAELEELEILVHVDRLVLCEELEELQRRRLVRERMVGAYIAYEFRHAFYREYVYNIQPLAKRRHMHHLVGEAYEKIRGQERWLEHLPFLIYQYEKSGDKEKADHYRREYELQMGQDGEV